MDQPPRITLLQQAMRKLPQVELGTWHYFSDSMYARVMECPAGSVVVGKIHRYEHFFIVTKGRVRVVTDQGSDDYEAGAVIAAHAMSKRAILGLEDSIIMTVHHTRKTVLDEIEEELIVPEEGVLFDARNKLKELT
jgi:quercetin dioxygenase-like cupin family protein